MWGTFMEKLKKRLSNKLDRPVFEVNAQDGNWRIRCLFDTGADIPVFTFGKEVLRLYFPNAILQEDFYAEISGFGKNEEQALIYKIPNFVIQSDVDQDYIKFYNLLIACIDKENIKYPLILSATMFKNMNYYVDNLQKDNKQLTIYHTRTMYGTGINAVSSKGKKKVIKYNSYIMSEDRIE